MLLMQKARRPFSLLLDKAGRSMAARIAMIAITTSSSMRVKALSRAREKQARNRRFSNRERLKVAGFILLVYHTETCVQDKFAEFAKRISHTREARGFHHAGKKERIGIPKTEPGASLLCRFISHRLRPFIDKTPHHLIAVIPSERTRPHSWQRTYACGKNIQEPQNHDLPPGTRTRRTPGRAQTLPQAGGQSSTASRVPRSPRKRR